MIKKLTINIPFILIIIATSMDCSQRQNKYQISPLPSRDKKYILTVPIIHKKRNGFTHWWQVTISDSSKKILYKDTEGFPARFNVYWDWDNKNRIWLKNSDDGFVYYWELKNEGWNKILFDSNQNDVKIPEDFHPY